MTRVVVTQEGLDEAMRRALAASEADVVKKNQMGGVKPVLLLGSPMRCIIAIKSQKVVERRIKRPGRNANRVSEVNYKNFVEQCVRHPEEKKMYQVPGNVGKLFLHENLWDRWSRGLSFVKEMTRSNDLHKTTSELCRAQLLMWSPRIGSCFKSKSEYITGELSMCCGNNDEQTKTHVKNVMLMAFRGLKRERVMELKFAKDQGSG